MIRFRNTLSLFILLALVSNCKKESSLGTSPSLDEVKSYVHNTHDSWAVFTYAQYKTLLTELQKDKYTVLTVNDFRSYYNPNKVVVALRHDIDWHPFKALEMAQMEKDYGLTSTWYVLPTAPYFAKYSTRKVNRFTSMIPLYQSIQDCGCEVGIHNDLLTAMVIYKLDPKEVNDNDLNFFHNSNIKIWGSAAHGATVAQKSHVINYEMYSDFTTRSSFTYYGKSFPLGSYSLKDYQFQYEAYHVDYDVYLSDVGGVWNVKGGQFEQMMKELSTTDIGKRVQILVHPVWWGK